MGTFKDAIMADIKSVFLNGLEFAEEHNINGSMVTCVVDKDIITQRNQRSYAEYPEGVFKSQLLIFVKKSDLSRVPVKGEAIRFNHELYMVDDVAENMGVLEITIGANDT